MKQSLHIIALLIWPLYFNDLYLIPIGNDWLGLLWALDVVFFFLIPAATLLWLFRTKRVLPSAIGLTAPFRFLSVVAGLALCYVLLVVVHGMLLPRVNSLPGRLFMGYGFPPAQPLRLGLMLYAALSAGILEEIVYRGVVTTELEKHIRSPVAVVCLSCLVFAGIHWGEGPGKVLSTFVWAIIPTIWFLKRRTLWGPMVCHALYDFLVFRVWV